MYPAICSFPRCIIVLILLYLYIAAVPPGESVHGFFNDHVKGFHMALLIDNPCAIVGDQTNALFDTRSPGMTAEKIAKYAKVEKFEKLI